jgi:putative PIN family toxin of toxin-antitoxin system
MRVFLDTNVLASGFATRGLCEDVLREVLTSHNLLVSQSVLQELERVLTVKFGVSGPLADEALSLLKKDSIQTQPGSLPNIKLKDKADLAILSAALEGKADVFITGDKELLNLIKVNSLTILSPRAFWDAYKKAK